jgi:hypothetical protein
MVCATHKFTESPKQKLQETKNQTRHAAYEAHKKRQAAVIVYYCKFK